jgi:hypothetical protein
MQTAGGIFASITLKARITDVNTWELKTLHAFTNLKEVE